MPGPNSPSPAKAPASNRARQSRPPSRQKKMANPTMASGQKPHGGTDNVRRTPAAKAGAATAGTEGRTAGESAMRHPRRATPPAHSHPDGPHVVCPSPANFEDFRSSDDENPSKFGVM